MSVIAAGGLLAVVFVTVAGAGTPTGGVSCTATDGKISGGGASFPNTAQRSVFRTNYRDEVCGPVASDAASGDAMVAYNFPSGHPSGSGNGLQAALCRTDAFYGSDIPYDEVQWGQLGQAPGTTVEGQNGCAGFNGTYTPAYGPLPSYPFSGGTTFPPNPIGTVTAGSLAADAAAQPMSFPIAGSSVAIGINLTNTDCGGQVVPAAPNLDRQVISDLFSGKYAQWSDVPGFPAGCTVAVKRAVRAKNPLDNSGTTSIFKRYLADIDGTDRDCSTGGGHPYHWNGNDNPNVDWPGQDLTDPNGLTVFAGCAAIIRPALSGGGNLVALCRATTGAVCYADLADIKTPGNTLKLARLRNGTGTTFRDPFVSSTANCDFSTLSLPGSDFAGNVGLDPTDNWGTDNAAGSHVDFVNQGPAYPICGLTFQIVYPLATTPNATARITLNQRRSLWSYMLYILSEPGQTGLTSGNYQRIGAGDIESLRNGFKANF